MPSADSSILPLRRRPVVMAGLMVAFAVLMALGAQVDVPMTPVPMSLQSLAVLLAGAVLGWRWGAGAVLIYLLAGGLGLPVFAGGASGWSHFGGPTAGYLAAFPLAAVAMGLTVARGWLDGPLSAFATGLGGHGLLLGLGAGWLATSIGVTEALSGGLWPFLPGAVVKSAVFALITATAARRFRPTIT